MSGTQGQDEGGSILRGEGVTVIDAGDLMAAVKAKRGQRGGGKPPVDSKTRAKIRRLAREGLSQSEVARRCDVSRSTVAKVCAESRPPISFDRSKTREAVAAHAVDLKARRQRLAADMLDDVDQLRARMWTEHTVQGVTKDGEHWQYEDVYGPRDLQALFTSTGIAIDKHLVLVRHDSDGGELSGLDAFLNHLMPGRTTEPVE